MKQAIGPGNDVANADRRVEHSGRRSFHLPRLTIGPRLTLCFVVIILVMLVGNAILLWQFHLARTQFERLSDVDQELIVVLQLHTDLMSFYQQLEVVAHSENTAQLLAEAQSLRSGFLEDTQRSRGALNRLSAEAQPDPALIPNLEAIQSALPPQIDAIMALAKLKDWEAVRLRLDKDVRPLESKTSALVQNVDHQGSQERARVVANIRHAQRRVLLIVPATALLTLLIAAFLGLAVSHSITQPLGRLMEGSNALARGDFHHRVQIEGSDELAQLGQVFNGAATRLRDLYESLRTKENYLGEGQRLSHTGSFGWNVSSGDIFWTNETFRIFEADGSTKPTLEFALQRVHPGDRAMVQSTLDRASRDGNDFELEYRLLMPGGSAKYVRVVSRGARDQNGALEFTGSIMDVTDHHEAKAALEAALEEIKGLKDRLYKENLALKDEIDQSSMFEEIVGTSPALQTVLARVAKVAPTDSTVLITGETGTGKELIARAVHRRSHRSSRAFVSVNCAAIPRELIASELFGHEKGAFTGAAQQRLGRFELADGGTLFLDEVGELPAATQIALLRVLQEREFERVGGTRAIKTDVRLIAATNRHLESAISAGVFRLDLFYRLNVFPIEMPPLRERRQDVPLLVEYFIGRYARKAGKTIRRVNKKSLELLQAYPWPGNIRELQNVIERSVTLCDSEDFYIDESWLHPPASGSEQRNALALSQRLATQEKEMIEEALRASRGRISGPAGAAAVLGIPRQTLEAKIRSLKINKFLFKGQSV